jgi:hypothetical protein
MARSSLDNSSAGVRRWSRTILVGSSHEAHTSFLVKSFLDRILSLTNSICLSVGSHFSPFVFLHRVSSIIGIDSSTAHLKPPIDKSHPEMSHPRRQLDSDYLAHDYFNSDSGRPSKRRNLDPTSQPRPSLGPSPYPHQQPSSQYLYPPETNGFGQASFEFPSPIGSNQAFTHLEAWSNLPMQNNFPNLAGDDFQFADGRNSLYPANTSGYVYNPGEPSLQPPFDWNAPVIAQTRSGHPYDDGHRATNEANWSALGPPAPSNYINPAPSQPTYGINLAPGPSQNTYYPPMNNALGGTFTTTEIGATCRSTFSNQTDYSNDLLHRPAVSPGRRQGTVKANSRPGSYGVTTSITLVPSITVPSGREESDTVPAWNSRREALLTIPAGPTHDGLLKKGDNCPPKKRKRQFPRDSLVPLRTSSGAPVKFLDPRPDPLDATKIPCSTLSTGLLVMGVFDGRVSMCYIHSASPPSRTSGQQLEHCDKAERDTEIHLGQRGNGISSLIQNSYRWTALLPRSSAEKPNGLVTLQNRSSKSHWDRGKHYSTGDAQKASLCVAAAALSTFAMPCRPVFNKKLYDNIRTGAHKISRQPASCPRSGVNNCSFEEVCKLMDVPPKWRDIRLPLVRIAGQWVGDGPEFMSVDSG